jgi:dipeptidyl aminopeptidase/acylaminoacyl peptidase
MTAFARLPACLLFFLSLTAAASAAPLPVADFLRRAEISDARISEDGRYVSFLSPSRKEYYDLNVYDTRTKESKKFDLGGDDVLGYRWLDSHRILLETQNRPDYRFRQQIFDVQQGKISANLSYARQHFTLISSLRRDPALFVVYFPDDRRGSAGLAVINTKLRPKTMAGADNSRFNVQEWIDIPKGEFHGAAADQNGEVRFVALYHDKQLHYYYRTGPSASWTALPWDYETTEFRGFTSDPDYVYVSRYTRDAQSSRLHRYRVSTQDYGPVLLEDPFYSMSDATMIEVRQPDGSLRTLALAYDRDVPTIRPIDPVYAEVMTAINAKLPGRLNFVRDCDYNLDTFVVGSTNGREPVRYAIYHRADHSFLPLPAPTPWFKPAEMSVMRPIRFKARDGLELEGYLSLPAPRPDDGKPPLVVYVHGGPWTRDKWDFDPDVQLLTSRGYAVFQPNYRGSTGYSRAISKDDEFEFRKMCDDVTDGVRQLVAQGVVDGKRIAIFGASFGGYQAIAGAAFEPDLYRCAITFAGVFDWKQLIRQAWANSDEDEFNYDRLIARLGDPARQQSRFDDMSPISHIAAIRCPVLVMHGKLDQTVDVRQSIRLLNELKAHNVPHEELFFDTEVHGFIERENRRKFLEAVESFLAKHL